MPNVKGLNDLMKALDALPGKLANNCLRGALRAGAKVVANEAKRMCPQLSGELVKTIRYDVDRPKGSDAYAAYVKCGPKKAPARKAPAKGRKKARQPAQPDRRGWYAHFVEFGTVRSPARPFMRPAFDAKQAEAMAAFGAYIRKRLLTKHGIDVPGPDNERGAEE